MSAGKITDELRAFIHHYINSIEQLEILLLLRRERNTAWSPSTIASALYIQPESADARLTDLETKGICAKDADRGGYVFEPATEQIERLVDELAEAYRVRPVAVISAIFSTPDHDLDSSADTSVNPV